MWLRKTQTRSASDQKTGLYPCFLILVSWSLLFEFMPATSFPWFLTPPYFSTQLNGTNQIGYMLHVITCTMHSIYFSFTQDTINYLLIPTSLHWYTRHWVCVKNQWCFPGTKGRVRRMQCPPPWVVWCCYRTLLGCLFQVMPPLLQFHLELEQNHPWAGEAPHGHVAISPCRTSASCHKSHTVIGQHKTQQK